MYKSCGIIDILVKGVEEVFFRGIQNIWAHIKLNKKEGKNVIDVQNEYNIIDGENNFYFK